MIKKLFITLICILTCIVTCTLTVQACSLGEYNKLAEETSGVCQVFKTTCTIKLVEHPKMWAQTKAYGAIEISTELVDKMNEAQVRGVLYHEAGHAVLQHVEKSAEYLYTTKRMGTYNETLYHNMRRQYELQADRFAVFTGILINKDTDLAGALRILTPLDQYYTTHSSHPSTADRINQIQFIQERYSNARETL